MQEALCWDLVTRLEREHTRPDQPMTLRNVTGRLHRSKTELEGAERPGRHALDHAQRHNIQPFNRIASRNPQETVELRFVVFSQSAGQAMTEQPGTIEKETQAL